MVEDYSQHEEEPVSVTWQRLVQGLLGALVLIGTGFMLPPTHFEFDLAIRGDTTPRFVGGDAEKATHWRVCALSSSPNCAGAVAARRTDWSIVNMN